MIRRIKWLNIVAVIAGWKYIQLLVVVCILTGVLLLFYTQSTKASVIDTRSEWDGALSSGAPMLVELYSDY